MVHSERTWENPLPWADRARPAHGDGLVEGAGGPAAPSLCCSSLPRLPLPESRAGRAGATARPRPSSGARPFGLPPARSECARPGPAYDTLYISTPLTNPG